MSNGFGQISLSCLKTFLAGIAKDKSSNKKPSDLQFWFMELSGKLSNALHLQQQTQCGGEWRSLPWAAKNGKSARAENLDVSLESLYPPQFNDKFCKIHWGPCPAQAVARGVWAWLHTQPAAQLGQKETQNCFSTLNYCFPGAGQVFEEECSSGWAILKDVFPAQLQSWRRARPSSSLLQGMATTQRSSSPGTNPPTPAAASAHLAPVGARINAQTNPDWGRFTQSTE